MPVCTRPSPPPFLRLAVIRGRRVWRRRLTAPVFAKLCRSPTTWSFRESKGDACTVGFFWNSRPSAWDALTDVEGLPAWTTSFALQRIGWVSLLPFVFLAVALSSSCAGQSVAWISTHASEIAGYL